MSKTHHALLISALFVFFIGAIVVHAQQFTSASFQILDPVQAPGGYGTSTSFQLYGAFSQPAIGTSTTPAGFISVNAGFLYFPFVKTPIVAATAGNTQVALSWTSATAALGWSVGGYRVGQSTTSGGAYTYSGVGLALSNTVTGLTNGTTYYFVINVLDAFGNPIANSSEVSATPQGAGGGGGGGGGGSSGGGGGGGTYGGPSNATVNFSGRAYPGSDVTLLKDGQVVADVAADPAANFALSISIANSGNYIFSLYSEDKRGVRSSLVTFPVSVTAGATTNVTGIFLAPTIAVDKSQVKQGDTIQIFGESAPASKITITVNSTQTIFATTSADSHGAYLYDFDTTPLDLGDHTTKSKAALTDQISPYSNAVGFIVGTENIIATTKCRKGDLNGDTRVNLIDFSIAAYWFKQPLVGPIVAIEKNCLDGDGKIDLVDFSIMAYYWTG